MASITNPTGRKTQAHVVTIGANRYFFSYETCIAFHGIANHTPEHGGKPEIAKVRLDNHWGPTTGKHFRELGCSNFDVVSPELFDKIVNNSIVR